MAIRVSKFLKQKLVYWRKTGTGGSGQPVFAPPVEVTCRWEDESAQTLTPDNRVITSRAHLLTEYLLVVGSIVWLGTLAQWRASPAYPNRPTTVQGGYETYRVCHTPDLRGNNLLYEAFL